eukprot:gene7244-9876_t
MIKSPKSTFQKQIHNPASFRSKVKLYSLLPSTDLWPLWTVVAGSSALGLKLERSTKIGRSLSGPVCAMIITATLTNFDIIPSNSMHITQLQSFVVKLATPLLLLGSNLFKIYKDTGSLFNIYLVGSLGTMIGSFLGYLMYGYQLKQLGLIDDGWKIASALTAKNIGGGLNFMAVANILSISPKVIAMGLAVDNILGLLYFPLISWLGQRYNSFEINKTITAESEDSFTNNKLIDNHTLIDNDTIHNKNNSNELENLSVGLAVGMVITTVSEFLSTILNTPSIVISTFLAVLIATIFSKQVESIVEPSSLIGKLLLLLFFGSIGNSSGNILEIFQTIGTQSLFGYGIILYICHFIIIFGVGKYFKFTTPDILLASNANIGNAATASSLASSMGWNKRLLPAILVGNFGNFLGTFAGLWLGFNVLQKVVR